MFRAASPASFNPGFNPTRGSDDERSCPRTETSAASSTAAQHNTLVA
jgi:hypothetical protein